LPGGQQPKITRLSKAITALLIIIYAVYFFVPSTSTYLALVPGRTLPCVWNLVTAGFFTTNVVKLAFEVVSLLLLARLVEPMYGSKEFLKFLFIVDFSVCFMVFVAVYITYAATASGKLLYTEFSGFHGIVAGLLVAVKQIMPDHEVKLFGVLSITVKYLPSILLLVLTALAAALKQYDQLAFLYLGAYNAWVYLRFFQQQSDNAYQGDPSDDFKFSSFFPPFMATPIDAVAGLLGIVFRLRHTAGADAKGMNINGAPSMLGSDSADANRRRERGAKALEERLGMKKHGSDADVEKAAGAAPAAEGSSAAAAQ